MHLIVQHAKLRKKASSMINFNICKELAYATAAKGVAAVG